MIRVLNGGVLTTVQDRGRRGWGRAGVPQSGAMDQFALHVANRLVGNDADAAVLEVTAGGAAFQFEASALVALTGGNLHAVLDDTPLPLWTAVFVRAGSHLSVTGRRGTVGARVYLAVAGGIAVPRVLESHSTYLSGGFGGYEGCSLRAGDLLDVGPTTGDFAALAGRSWPSAARPQYHPEPTLRFIPGPHHNLFTADTLTMLNRHAFSVDARSNRMGYRLIGPPLSLRSPLSVPSFGVLPGVVQVPPDGTPILLMADAQPTGGYPVIGVVIAADLPLAAQLLPGDTVRFAEISVAEGFAAWHTMEQWREIALDEDAIVPLLKWAGA